MTNELTARIEAATGPDRELDEQITLSRGYYVLGQNWPELPQWYNPDRDRLMHRHGDPAFPPAYTASLDAALTLVPEGWAWSITTADAKGAFLADVWTDETEDREFAARGYTPALAICAAALRAKEAL